MQTAIRKNAFYRVEQGALGMSLWNQRGGGPEKFGNHCTNLSQVKVKVTLRLTISQSWCQTQSGAHDRIFINGSVFYQSHCLQYK
jgi:hypothetical protein